MTITSRELHEAELREADDRRRREAAAQPAPATTVLPRVHGAWPVGVALLLFGIPLWIAGGKYTIQGWIEWGNWFLIWLGVSSRIPPLAGWWLLLILPVAYLYSEVEVRHRPFGRRGKHATPPLVWVAWILVVGTDLASTYVGVRNPAPGAFALTIQVAAQPAIAGIWAIILTFLPEWLMLGGVIYLRGK